MGEGRVRERCQRRRPPKKFMIGSKPSSMTNTREKVSLIFVCGIFLFTFAAANVPFLRPPVELPVPVGNDAADDLLAEAQKALAERNFPRAQELASQAIERQPAFAQAHLALAQALDRQGQSAPALPHYQRAADLFFELYEAYM